MKEQTKEQAVQHLEDNNLDNVQINSIKDTPYYVSDVMADFALSLSPVSELEDRWNLVQEFKESAEFKRLTLELGIDRESAIIAAGKFIDWYRNTHAQKPQLTEAKVLEIIGKQFPGYILNGDGIMSDKLHIIAKEITQQETEEK